MIVQNAVDRKRRFVTWVTWLWVVSVPLSVGTGAFRLFFIYVIQKWSDKPFLLLFEAFANSVGLLAMSYFLAGPVALFAKDPVAILYVTNVLLMISLLFRSVLQARLILVVFGYGFTQKVSLLFTREATVWFYVGIEFFIVLALAKHFRTESDLGINSGCLFVMIALLLMGFGLAADLPTSW